MSELDADLMAEELRVRGLVSSFEQSQFVVAIGDDDEAALLVNDQVARLLSDARDAGHLEDFQNIHALLPSATQQRAVSAAIRTDETLWPRFVTAFEAAGFRSAAFTPFREELALADAELPEALRWDDLSASPLAALVRALRIELDGRVAYLSFVRGVTNDGALRAELSSIDGALFLDQGALMGDANQAYQLRTAELLLAGLVTVFLLLLARYRSVRPALAAFVPSVLAALVTVATLSAAGIALNLVTLTALLMVVSMGVDYGVFLVDAERENDSGDGEHDELGHTLLSVCVAGFSTLLGFGLLALSSYPILFQIGVTASVGVFSALVLAPTTLVLLRSKADT